MPRNKFRGCQRHSVQGTQEINAVCFFCPLDSELFRVSEFIPWQFSLS
jgi:hypothetical protein